MSFCFFSRFIKKAKVQKYLNSKLDNDSLIKLLKILAINEYLVYRFILKRKLLKLKSTKTGWLGETPLYNIQFI